MKKVEMEKECKFCKLIWATQKTNKERPRCKKLVLFFTNLYTTYKRSYISWRIFGKLCWEFKVGRRVRIFFFIHFYFILFLWIALQRHFEKPRALQTRIRLKPGQNIVSPFGMFWYCLKPCMCALFFKHSFYKNNDEK